MTEEAGGVKKWDWLPQQMPGVARLMADRRKELGPQWVAECWKQGVLKLQPGWFYAREGALTVGVPWDATRELERECEARAGHYAAVVFVVLKTKEGDAHGQD